VATLEKIALPVLPGRAVHYRRIGGIGLRVIPQLYCGRFTMKYRAEFLRHWTWFLRRFIIRILNF
jgi:hypothetical protein